jgi:hypothetical protein
MSIRALALELYRAQQAVDTLQKALEKAPPAERDGLTQELRVARKELEMLRKMLEGRKESGLSRKKTVFGGRKF